MLSEWHIDPEVVFETWTEEKLSLLLKRRNRKVERLNRLASGEPEYEGITSMDQLREAARQRQLASQR